LGGSLLNSGVWVQFEHSLDVFQWILLDGNSLGCRSSWLQGGLDFISLKDSLEISIGHDWSWHGESLLVVGAVDSIEGLEGGGGPDAESTNVSTWGEFEQVEFVNWEEGDTWDISESEGQTIILGIDDQWASLLNASSVSHFTTSGTESSGGFDTFNISPGVGLTKNTDGILGLGQSLNRVFDNQWEFWNLFDSVTLGHGQRWESSGGDGGDGGITSLSDIDLSEPSSPGLVWVEHTTTSAHVTESGSTRSGGTTTTDTWDTSNGTTGTP